MVGFIFIKNEGKDGGLVDKSKEIVEYSDATRLIKKWFRIDDVKKA